MAQQSLSTIEAKEFIKAVSKLRDAKEAEEFFGDLFTPAEAQTFAMRWKAAQMLHAGLPYTDIQKLTGLSSATIARVSQALQFGKGGYHKILDRTQRTGAKRRN